MRSMILRNTMWSSFSVVATPVLAFLFGGLTLRYLGLQQAGYAIAVAAVYGVAGRFASFGVGSAALPSLAAAIAAGDEWKTRRLIGLLLLVFGVSAAVTAGLFMVAVPWFNRWAESPLTTQTALSYVAACGVGHVLGQINVALTTVLRAANRYDLVTMATTPLAFVTGLAACTLLPLFPSLMTAGLVTATSAAIGTALTLWFASGAVPAVRRPLAGVGEIPQFARYGGWLLLGNAFASFTTGIDELAITGLCGTAAVPPWAIGKRLWNTVHTFLAQHVEHLVPLLGSLHSAEEERVRRIAIGIHWYVMLVAGAIYTLMAWGGESAVGVVAGSEIAPTCRPAIQSFSLFGLCFALLIVPVTLALAKGISRPAFEVSVALQVAVFVPLCVLAWALGSRWLSYAPLLGAPLVLGALVTTAARVGDVHAFRAWLRPVAIPVALAGLAIIAAMPTTGLSPVAALAVGGFLAAGVIAGTLGVEKVIGVNHECHAELVAIMALGGGHFGRVSRKVVGALQRSRP